MRELLEMLDRMYFECDYCDNRVEARRLGVVVNGSTRPVLVLPSPRCPCRPGGSGVLPPEMALRDLGEDR